MDDFELTDSRLAIPLVLSMFPSLLKQVWQNRVINHGMDDYEFPTWEEIFHIEVHLDEAWQLLVRCPRSIRHLI